MIKFLRILNYIVITLLMCLNLIMGIIAYHKQDWLMLCTNIILLVAGSYAYTWNKSKRSILGISLYLVCTFSYAIFKNLFPSIWFVFAILFGVIFIVGDYKIEKKYKVIEDAKK